MEGNIEGKKNLWKVSVFPQVHSIYCIFQTAPLHQMADTLRHPFTVRFIPTGNLVTDEANLHGFEGSHLKGTHTNTVRKMLLH